MARLNTTNATLPDEFEHVTWNFEPLCPVRRHHTGEVAFMRTFQRAMGGTTQLIDLDFLTNDSHLFPFLKILKNMGFPQEGDDRLVATFMLWLGTNLGAGFRSRAEQLFVKTAVAFMTREDAYLSIWAIENRKIAGLTSYPRLAITQNLKATFNREVTLRDYEVLEQAVSWLGSDAGQDYLAAADKSKNRWDQRITAQRRAAAGRPQLPHSLS